MVVTLKVALTPPIVSVALVVVAYEPDEVNCTLTLSLLLTVPAADVKSLPLVE
jgi:hypothetical protein